MTELNFNLPTFHPTYHPNPTAIILKRAYIDRKDGYTLKKTQGEAIRAFKALWAI